MSEAEDRKGKAARAKALLKKRQQGTRSEESPPPPRASTSLLPDPPPEYSPTTQVDETQSTADPFGQTSERDGVQLNSLSRVDDAPPSPSTVGVFAQQEKHSSPPARLPPDEPPMNSQTHSLLQSLRAELQRYQDTTASLKSERDALKKELDQRRDLETKLRRETNNGTPLAQTVQHLESKLRSATSRVEELEGLLARSRSEREGLLASLEGAEAARQYLEGRLGHALNVVANLENQLRVSQQELQTVWRN